jgi:methylated-DNA-[protein]-cysteine S-methyltransferase
VEANTIIGKVKLGHTRHIKIVLRGSILVNIYYTNMETPIGEIWVAASEQGLRSVHVKGSEEKLLKKFIVAKDECFYESERFFVLNKQISEYFHGKRKTFEVSFDLKGTNFQKKVWNAIYSIPFGYLSSYGRLAKDIGLPSAQRAVGNAVGDNPIGLIIPCHRVVKSDGGLGGFGGDLYTKRQLLTYEGVFNSPEGFPEKGNDLRRFFK